MTLLKKTELNAMKQRCNQINSQEWKICKVVVGNVSFYDVITNDDSSRPYTKQECEFIIHAQKDIPKLIQHIDSLQNLLFQYKQVLGELGYHPEKKIV